MPNALAIAGVTATLIDVLARGIQDADLDSMGDIDVTSKAPDQISEEMTNSLNIFPWKVTHNPHLANSMLPERGKNGQRLTNHRLHLDLHFMLTANGPSGLNAAILLGYGMQQLNEIPFIQSSLVRDAIGRPTPPGTILPAIYSLLQKSDLADGIEHIRLTPSKKEDEDLTEIWPAFNAALRLTSLYQASVVMIEKPRVPKASLPVQQVALAVNPLRLPRLRTAERQTDVNDPGSATEPFKAITWGDRIKLTGNGLSSDNVRVLIKKSDITNTVIEDQEISAVLAPALLAGLQLVEVEHLYLSGSGQVRQREISNGLPIAITPKVNNIGVSGTVTRGEFSGVVAVDFAHNIGRDQQVVLYLDTLPNQSGPARPSVSVAYFAPKRTADATSLSFQVEGLISGIYMYRISVDNARTDLDYDMTGVGGYTGPRVTVP